jgi:hypothetical protein
MKRKNKERKMEKYNNNAVKNKQENSKGMKEPTGKRKCVF